MKCIIYSRVSTTEQAETGRSIGDQVKICARFAEENDYDIVGIFKDKGKTATNMNRAGLQDMILKCQEDKDIDAILVLDSDRLARNTSNHLQIKATLKIVGTKVISVSQPMLNDDTPEGQLIDTIIASTNAFQSQITGRKVAKCMMEKFREGWWPSVAYIGYTNTNIGTLDRPINIIGDDDVRQKFIKKAFKLFSTGTYSSDEVNSILYKKGFQSSAGKKYSSAQFARILKNSFYYGLMQFKGEKKMGLHKHIISKEIFKQCQNVFEEHNHRANRSRKHDFLLRGFVFCGICGHRLTAEPHILKGKSYYHCASKKHSNRHQNMNVSELELRVEKLFNQIQLPESLIIKMKGEARKFLEENHGKVNAEKKLLNLRKGQLEKDRDVLEKKLVAEVIGDETYKRQYAEIEGKIKAIDKELREVESGRQENVEVMERLMALSSDVGKAYQDAPPQLKKNYLSTFWERIDVENRKIENAVPTKFYKSLFPDYNENLVAEKPITPIVITSVRWRPQWVSNPYYKIENLAS